MLKIKRPDFNCNQTLDKVFMIYVDNFGYDRFLHANYTERFVEMLKSNFPGMHLALSNAKFFSSSITNAGMRRIFMGFEDSQTNSWNNHRPQKDDINLSLMKALLDAGLKTNVAHETRFFQRLFPADFCNQQCYSESDFKLFKNFQFASDQNFSNATLNIIMSSKLDYYRHKYSTVSDNALEREEKDLQWIFDLIHTNEKSRNLIEKILYIFVTDHGSFVNHHGSGVEVEHNVPILTLSNVPTQTVPSRALFYNSSNYEVATTISLLLGAEIPSLASGDFLEQLEPIVNPDDLKCYKSKIENRQEYFLNAHRKINPLFSYADIKSYQMLGRSYLHSRMLMAYNIARFTAFGMALCLISIFAKDEQNTWLFCFVLVNSALIDGLPREYSFFLPCLMQSGVLLLMIGSFLRESSINLADLKSSKNKTKIICLFIMICGIVIKLAITPSAYLVDTLNTVVLKLSMPLDLIVLTICSMTIFYSYLLVLGINFAPLSSDKSLMIVFWLLSTIFLTLILNGNLNSFIPNSHLTKKSSVIFGISVLSYALISIVFGVLLQKNSNVSNFYYYSLLALMICSQIALPFVDDINFLSFSIEILSLNTLFLLSLQSDLTSSPLFLFELLFYFIGDSLWYSMGWQNTFNQLTNQKSFRIRSNAKKFIVSLRYWIPKLFTNAYVANRLIASKNRSFDFGQSIANIVLIRAYDAVYKFSTQSHAFLIDQPRIVRENHVECSILKLIVDTLVEFGSLIAFVIVACILKRKRLIIKSDVFL